MAVALVGLPGAGKSAVGRRLAQRLQLPFIDSDHVIEERIGCSIRDYFEREGEASFRDLEQAVIAELAAAPHGVVATGGGSVLREANRNQLRERFHVIYLRSAPEDLFRRLRHDVKRPLLQVADPLGRLRELYGARDPLYRETAHDVVETGRPTVGMLVNIIVMQLELAGIATPGPEGDLRD
ncbi:shikimate kinase [Variovorax sp. J22R24]|uniref:shikimate kinase n=1 Tax=Variovorax gracilis TaxID=3053502 RepID=UPI0025762699|nr:shikimate kinase [Variovorax sp. J22R24]MDM0104912.1 shikimate kinase [Variovorax sp. J22R24]